jgi:hypothetical protein
MLGFYFFVPKKEEWKMSELSTEATRLAVSVLVALMGLVCSYIILYLHQAAQKVREQIKSIKGIRDAESLDVAISRLEDAVQKTVLKIEQTVAGELRQKVKKGDASKEELAALGKQAFNEVVNILSEDAKKLLWQGMGDLNQYIENAIEAEVRRIKGQPNLLLSSNDSLSVHPGGTI